MNDSKTLICHWNGCLLEFTTANVLHQHIEQHLETDYKSNPLNSASKASSPSQLVINTSTGQYKCLWDQCTFLSDRYHGLKSHIATHIPYKPFRCDICDRPFKRRYDMQKHKKSVHYRGIDEILLLKD